MKKNNKIMGFVAVLLAAVMIAGAILSAQAAGTLSSSDIDKIVNTETDASLVANPFTAAVAAVLNGYCSYDQDITVHLKGGAVIIRYSSDGTVSMTGDAKTVFQGTVEL